MNSVSYWLRAIYILFLFYIYKKERKYILIKNPPDKLCRKLYQSTTRILITIYYEYYLLLDAYQMLENPIKTGRGVFEEPLALKFIF